MTVVNSYVTYCFDRYQKGCLKEAEVVSQLLKTKVAKVCLLKLMEEISKIPHWQEQQKLKNLHVFVKTSLKNNFPGTKGSLRPAFPSRIMRQNVIDQGMTHLTQDLWGMIANRMPNVQPLFRLASTCKEAYFLRDEMLARSSTQLSLYLQELLAKKDEKQIMRFLGSCSEVCYANTPVTLRITSTWPRQFICLHEIQKKFPNIVLLQIAKHDLDDDDFEMLLAACPTLKGLDLSQCTALTTPALARARYPVNLEKLILNGTQLNDTGLQQICTRLTTLKELDVRACPLLTLNGRFTVELPKSIEMYKVDSQDDKTFLRALLESHPQHPIVLAQAMFDRMMKAEDFDEICPKVKKALEAYPKQCQLQMAHGLMLLSYATTSLRHDHEKMGQLLKEAEPLLSAHMHRFNEVFGDRLGNGLIIAIFAMIQFLLQRYGEAKRLVEAGLKKNPNDGDLINFMGLIFMQQGPGFVRDFQQAVKYLNLAVAKQADESRALLLLAMIYIEGGDGIAPQVDEAKKSLVAALNKDAEVMSDPFIRTKPYLMRMAKLGKMVLDDPELKARHEAEVRKFFKALLEDAPDNKELKSLILLTLLK